MPTPGSLTYLDSDICDPSMTPETHLSRKIDFGQSQNIITLHPFTITSTNSTPAVLNVGATSNQRPCVNFAGAGAATDGNNLCFAVASIIPVASKPLIVKGSLFSADITNHEFLFGMGVVGTGVIATDPTDHFMIRKLTGETVPSVRSRKASGTANIAALNTGALANSTWYDFAIRCTVDASTSGAGRLEVWWGSNLTGGQAMAKIYDNVFGTNVPDTVKLAPQCAFRAGGSVTTIMSFGYYQFEQAGLNRVW